MNERQKELLDIFERFGDNAQNAIDFVRANDSDIQHNDCVVTEEMRQQLGIETSEKIRRVSLKTPGDGIYIVYQDGQYMPFSTKDSGDFIKKEEGMRVGISYGGHTWCIGTDYGDRKWTEASEEALKSNTSGIMEEYEAIIDWDIEGINLDLREFWTHIPFKDGELMPVCPMVLVQEYAAKHGLLNAALEFVGMKPYETGVLRWFAERDNVNYVRSLNGDNGFLSISNVNIALRTQAVTLWNP